MTLRFAGVMMTWKDLRRQLRMSTDKYFEEFPEVDGDSVQREKTPSAAPAVQPARTQENRLLVLWDGLSHAGLGEVVFRAGTQILSVALVLAVIWALRAFYLYTTNVKESNAVSQAALATSLPTPTAAPEAEEVVDIPLPPLSENVFAGSLGVVRQVTWHTIIPTRPRTQVITYTVQKDDTIFGIAQSFNLKPETILWGNYLTLIDDPHRLQPGMVLNILPLDGVYHKWSAGEGLNGVAKGYGVKPEDIIAWEGNHLSVESLGDWRNPNIEAGTFLIVPGGHRAFVTWSAPLGLTRKNPGVAKMMGPGACGTITEGAVGNGSFIWPANNHTLSGYDYSPGTNHLGVDIAGASGDPVFAADGGVVVYSGWNNWGYGYVVVVDHGNGWQTLYAHLSAIYAGCGQSVFQGTSIGAFGSTGNSSGPHLHFEMINSSYGKVNPWDFLP